MTNKENKLRFIDPKTDIKVVDCEKAFKALKENEKLYSYYFMRASWEGQKICYFDKSYESPALFYLFMKIFSLQSVEEVKVASQKSLFSDLEWQKLTYYVSAVLQNCGNYLSIGRTKFIPDIPLEKFEGFLKLTLAFELEPIKLRNIWENIKTEVYSYEIPFGTIQLIDQNGLSGYYSSKITHQDVIETQRFLDSINLSPLNTRVIKYNDKLFEITVCSLQSGGKSYEYNGRKYNVVYGEFNSIIYKVINFLTEALKYVENETQKQMVLSYIEHFKTGDVELHKESQRDWVQDALPTIETNMGFCEHYLDPKKFRGEWNGLVAVVNKEETHLLKQLVEKSTKILEVMPWPQEFQRVTTKSPVFLSLDVMTAATYNLFSGINIPNYDDIRTTLGFKNVNLRNCFPVPTKKNSTFTKEDVLDILEKHGHEAWFVQVSFHELLGHGSGRLFSPDEKIKNPQTGELLKIYYGDSGNYYNQFGDIGSAYEECRAEAVALYLCTYEEPLRVLVKEEKNWDDIMFCAWYNTLVKAVRDMHQYSVSLQAWGNDHTAGRFAILQVCLQAGNNFVNLEETEKDGKPYMFFSIDRAQIKTTGRNALARFLVELQTYKSSGDVEGAKNFFLQYSGVNEKFLKLREISLENRIPTPINLQPELSTSEGGVDYIRFEASSEGVIKSHVQHHSDSFEDVYSEWEIRKDYFKFNNNVQQQNYDIKRVQKNSKYEYVFNRRQLDSFLIEIKRSQGF